MVEHIDELIKGLHEDSVRLLVRALEGLADATPRIKRGEYSRAERVDAGYFMRQLEQTLDELRKEVAARRVLISQMLALELVQEHMADPSKDLRAVGRIASGTPDVRTRYRLPKPGTEEYVRIMGWLGVQPDAVQHGAMKFDFNGFSDLMMAREQVGGDGRPKGLSTFPEYGMTFRKLGGK